MKDVKTLEKEITRLTRENSKLRGQIAEYEAMEAEREQEKLDAAWNRLQAEKDAAKPVIPAKKQRAPRGSGVVQVSSNKDFGPHRHKPGTDANLIETAIANGAGLNPAAIIQATGLGRGRIIAHLRWRGVAI